MERKWIFLIILLVAILSVVLWVFFKDNIFDDSVVSLSCGRAGESCSYGTGAGCCAGYYCRAGGDNPFCFKKIIISHENTLAQLWLG